MMQKPTKLTEEEKQNGKRKLLIPSEEIQEMMEPIAFEDFAELITKTIPPSRSPDPETKRT
jgi:hypothetical protein